MLEISFALMNIALSGLFAAGFTTIAVTNEGRRSVYGFAASYAIGMLVLLSQLLMPHSSQPETFAATTNLFLVASLLAMTVSLARFYGVSVPWAAIYAVFLVAVALGWMISDAERRMLPYGLMHQIPFAAASGMSVWILIKCGRRRPLEAAAAIVFAAVALLFLAKPFFDAKSGFGLTSREDLLSFHYPLIYTTGSGILLTATGLLIILIVLQDIVREWQVASETDHLSGLANRRGFDSHTDRIFGKARRFQLPTAIAVFDIDHFKAINDTYGHAAGDEVIRAFAECLRRGSPKASVIARTGGEEFVLLCERTNQTTARLSAVSICAAAAQARAENVPPFTVSAGVIEVRPGESLREAMSRADCALYNAKQQGRNRVCIFDTESEAANDRPRLAS